MADCLPGYSYRKKLTVDSTLIDSSLTDFPVYVNLTDDNFDFAKAKSDLTDVVFTSDDAETLLSFDRDQVINEAPSLLGHYKLNDNLATTNVLDASGNGRDGTANTNTSGLNTTGQINDAFSLTTSDYIGLGTDSAWNFGTGNFAISLWFKIGSVSGERVLVAKRNWVSGTEDGYSIAFTSSTTIRVHYNTDADFTVSNIADDNWHHLVVNFNYDGASATVYLDNEYIGTEDYTQDSQSNANDLWIGRNQPNSVHWDGEVDDVRIYDDNISHHYIENIWNSGSGTESDIGTLNRAQFWVKLPSVSSSVDTDFYIFYGNDGASDGEDASNVWGSDLKGVYHLNEISDGTSGEFIDATGNGNNGQGGGGTASELPTRVDGLKGAGQAFDGNDDGIDIPHDADFNITTALRLKAWIWSGDYGQAFVRVVEKFGSSDSIWLGGVNSNSLYFGIWKGGGQTFFSNGGTLTDGQKHLIVWEWDGTTMRAYIDGVDTGTTASLSSPCDTSTGIVSIGRRGDGNSYFSGLIDEVNIGDTAQGADWAKAEYNSENETLLTFASEEECGPTQIDQEESEFIDLTENVIASPSLIKQNITEAIALSELTSKSLSRAVEEFIDLTENVASSQAITLAIQENLKLTEGEAKSLTKDILESLDLTENVDSNPSDIESLVDEGISLTENVTVSVAQVANNASKAIRINPMIFVTNTDPAKIVSVDISDPENPTHSVFTLTGASFAKDVAYNSATGFLYVACADGIVVKVDSTSLSTQTLIDLSDTDDLQTIEVLSAFNITYASTDNTTGELYLIDERETVLGDFRLDVLSTQTTFGDLQFDCIEGSSMDSNFTTLSYVLTGYMQTDFKCLSTALDSIEPIKQTDFVVKINGVQLGAYDVDLSSILINHVIGEESTATFRLNRKHDQMDTDLEGNSRQITNQNAVIITIQGNTEFSGNVSNISCQYTETDEFITVTANATEKASSYNVVNLSLPSLNSRLGLYDVMVQNPVIYNPIIDEDAENPIRYNGIRVDLGEKRVQSYSRYTFFDSFGSTAESIQNGTFVPRQNWTYFWGPTVRKFGDVELGDTSAITFFYIGTSLSPVSEDLWVLTNAKHRRQRQYEDIVTDLGNYEVGSAPFKDVSTRNGVFIPKFHWVDESNGLYSIKDAGYDFTEYAKEVADLELQKIQNINGDILPETSCTIGLTIDGYYYHGLKLLTRLNIDNTTQSGIYKNNNGFPVSIKGITIDSSTMKTSLQCDNLKSNAELEALDGLYPDEEDDRFNDDSDRILIAGKTDMKTRLSVE